MNRKLLHLGTGAAHRPVARAVSLGCFPPPTVEDEEPPARVSDQSDRRGYHRDSRAMVINAKLRDLQSKITVAQSALDSDIRLARNLAVLQPFTRTTRDRMVSAIPPLAKRIRVMRMDMAKLVCHRDVLAADLMAGEAEWQATLDMAMSAATSKLKQRKDLTMLVSSNGGGGKHDIPRMILSLHPDPNEEEPTHSAGGGITIPLPVMVGEMETSESFYSVKSVMDGSGDEFYSPQPMKTGEEDARGQSPSFPFPSNFTVVPEEGEPPLTPTRRSSVDMVSPLSPPAINPNATSPPPVKEKPMSPEVEQCEEWHKTRAAKRVSLVSLPSDRKLSTLSLLGRHSRTLSDTTEV